MGSTGWIVGPGIVGEGVVTGFGLKVCVGQFEKVVGLGSVDEVSCKFGIYCSFTFIE